MGKTTVPPRSQAVKSGGRCAAVERRQTGCLLTLLGLQLAFHFGEELFPLTALVVPLGVGQELARLLQRRFGILIALICDLRFRQADLVGGEICCDPNRILQVLDGLLRIANSDGWGRGSRDGRAHV